MADIPLPPGPFCEFGKKVLALKKTFALIYGNGGLIKLYLITARSEKVAQRVLTTINYCNLFFDYMFFLAGQSKEPVLEMIQPDIYIDDKIENLKWYLSRYVVVSLAFSQ